MRATTPEEMVGRKFGKLTVIDKGRTTSAGNILWLCECECGNTTHRSKSSLRANPNLSCGCYHKHNHGIVKHGMARTPTHGVWDAMKQRCLNPNNIAFANYGGRGISVCDRWKTFSNFHDDMGEKPPGMELDRIDVNGNYEPGNCRWATKKENNRNKRRTYMVTYEGRVMPLVECAEIVGMCRAVLRGRLDSGWDLHKAITTPVQKKRSKS